MALEYRSLGRSGLKVSALALGGAGFGTMKAFGELDEHDGKRIVDRALDAGVNLVDTADIYSGGMSEEIIGKLIRGRRDRLVVATKVRYPMSDRPNDVGLSRQHLVEGCEASLRRLATDYIDLYHVHGWDAKTPIEETLETLDLLVSQGKVRYIGCSNYSAWQLMKALAVSERRGLQRFVSHEIYYSLIGREAEYELVPLALDQGVGHLVWSPLAGGLLTGKYRRDRQGPAGARHTSGEWKEPPIKDWSPVFDVIESLVSVSGRRAGVSPAQVALAYLLGKPTIASVIIGARSEEQLVENLCAADVVLDEEERLELDRSSALPPQYPYWHQARD
jgi:aryl-alcohol dehydrogenase-like predicted oxidoreductase